MRIESRFHNPSFPSSADCRPEKQSRRETSSLLRLQVPSPEKSSSFSDFCNKIGSCLWYLISFQWLYSCFKTKKKEEAPTSKAFFIPDYPLTKDTSLKIAAHLNSLKTWEEKKKELDRISEVLFQRAKKSVVETAQKLSSQLYLAKDPARVYKESSLDKSVREMLETVGALCSLSYEARGQGVKNQVSLEGMNIMGDCLAALNNIGKEKPEVRSALEKTSFAYTHELLMTRVESMRKFCEGDQLSPPTLLKYPPKFLKAENIPNNDSTIVSWQYFSYFPYLPSSFLGNDAMLPDYLRRTPITFIHVSSFVPTS